MIRSAGKLSSILKTVDGSISSRPTRILCLLIQTVDVTPSARTPHDAIVMTVATGTVEEHDVIRTKERTVNGIDGRIHAYDQGPSESSRCIPALLFRPSVLGRRQPLASFLGMCGLDSVPR